MADLDQADLDNRFTYHPPTGNQTRNYEDIRAAARELAELVAFVAPSSRERSLAVTKIEEAVFWANAAIARHDVHQPSGEVGGPVEHKRWSE